MTTDARKTMAASYDPAQPLISIHVPKTGGSTVRAALRTWFDDELKLHYVTEETASAPSRHEAHGKRCIHGHFNRFRGFGVDDYYPDVHQYIVFLRDPFEQHVSLFHYICGLNRKFVFDGQTPPFAMYETFDAFFAYLRQATEGNYQATIANTFLAHLPAHLAEREPAGIFASFIHVGLTEQLDASLALLAKKIGRSPVLPQSENVSDKTRPIESGFRRQHEALFPREHAVYQALRRMHLDELHAHGYSMDAAAP